MSTFEQMKEEGISPRTVMGLVLGIVLLISVPFILMNTVQSVGPDEIVVIQDPFDGELHWYVTPGVKFQWFGNVTTYKKRSMYPFESRIRFNEGGHAILQGSVQWEMPLNQDTLSWIHSRFRNQESLTQQLVQIVTNKSIYMSGPLLSSTESYAEKRPSLLFWIEDQISNGIYQTSRRDVKQRDPITGEEKTVTIAEIAMDRAGHPIRQEVGQLTAYGIRPFNFAVTEITYDSIVESQIQLQQSNIMAVQTAIAQSRKAEQDALTAEQQGRAIAATERWKQEAIKAQKVTEAQQRLEVAQLDAQAADQERIANIRRGEGEATRRRMVLQADNALTQRLDAWLKAQTVWAENVPKYQGNWVPSLVMGNGTAAAGSGMNDIMTFLSASMARQISLDMNMGAPPRQQPSRQAAAGK